MRLCSWFLAAVAWCCVFEMANCQEIVDLWSYTFRRPTKGWQELEFDASSWKQGHGGFGTAGTPGSRVASTWTTRDIWLRKRYHLNQIPKQPALLIHHDEDCEVFINGEKVLQREGYVTQYEVVAIADDQLAALRVGENQLAVHCRQNSGGQFIDVHLIDAEKAPKMPPPTRNTKPYVSDLLTTWGASVTPDNAWREYPRPQMRRDQWTNLNGHWDYAVTDVGKQAIPETWDGKILVPFCLESKLGGVQRLLDGSEALWYRRNFQLQSNQGRQLLNFEAVDYRCKVYVNQVLVSEHQGGHTPFVVDITSAIRSGENELVVRVEDETENFQLRGKQVLSAEGIWYTQVSGIWQTVWLETVPESYIEKIKIATDFKSGEVEVRVLSKGPSAVAVEAWVEESGARIAQQRSKDLGEPVKLVVPADKLKLWSPDSPYLYDLRVRLIDGQDKAIDEVESYFGIRSVGKVQDAEGHLRLTLNGRVLFHFGPLDQGWWPDGLLTPPSDEGMLYDIQWLKSAGFNMIRKHIKVEPRRYYYHCDRLGMMVWQDQVSGGLNPAWTFLRPDPADADWPEEHHRQYLLEMERMIDNLENSPSIVCWVPFNEAWGQHQTLEVGRWTVRRDPSRLVNIASGGNFWPVGDIVDQHNYPDPAFPFELGADGRFDNFVKVVGEFGGHGFPIQGHLWDSQRGNWGYGSLPRTQAELKQRYVSSLEKLNFLRKQGIAAGVYTQTTDVEIEVNGLMTYDRKVIKIPAEQLRSLHLSLYE